MTEPEETIGTELAKIRGSIELLGQKLDAHRDLLLAKMEAGDRESGQAIALTNERVTNLAGKVSDNTARLDDLEKMAEPVPLISKLVYGFVGLVLIAVVTGLLALVLRGGA